MTDKIFDVSDINISRTYILECWHMDAGIFVIELEGRDVEGLSDSNTPFICPECKTEHYFQPEPQLFQIGYKIR